MRMLLVASALRDANRPEFCDDDAAQLDDYLNISTRRISRSIGETSLLRSLTVPNCAERAGGLPKFVQVAVRAAKIGPLV
jgi:hypothetical protein